MDKTYDPHTIEQHWYDRWESAGHFAPRGDGPPYCIMIPPPNVTGTLHMGHAFQHTLMDALIRYQRMRGRNTLWQVGTDHAGIATQMVVERQLNADGKTRHDIGRGGFEERVWQWKEQSGGTITRQMRRLGDSVDWSRERFTMDEGLSKAVAEVFVRLYDEGLIYRGKRLVNWDPVLKTALSDLEVISSEENGHLWHLRYPLADGSGHVVVATTRPETMLGDVAVAVHPDDERYRHLVGREIDLPLADRRIPIIADDYVDPEFGTGCVKITPAHDFNDYEIGERHGLPMINVLTPDAALNDAVPEAYRGLDRFEARKKIIADFESLGLLDKTDAHKLMVPRGDRSNAVVEPYLTDQWYMKMAPLAAPAIKAVEDGRIRFVPENWSKTYFEWMRNIHDWCISRQLWWGHRIPAWYDDAGNIYVARDEAEVRAKYRLDDDLTLTQDEDVLDTWFSSQLWPFSTLGWPDKTPELDTWYPTDVLVTGFDIIFFWVARMVMMGLKFMDDVPFHEIYITGLIRDEHGQKMSKSKGNILDPIDLIDGIGLDALIKKRTFGMMQPQLAEKVRKNTRKEFPNGIPAHGTDALRYTLAALAGPSRDINFDLGRLEGYRNFCNKLWNAARYVLMKLDATSGEGNEIEYGIAEQWIRSRLARTIAAVHEHLGTYRFDLAARALYEFTWNEYCDWYLELSKPLLDANAPAAQRNGTRETLAVVLETLLRLMHPLMPFITEEIWQKVAPLVERAGASIMLAPFPEADDFAIDTQAEAEMQWLMGFVLGVRQIRGEMDIAPGKPLPVLLADAGDDDCRRLEAYDGLIRSLAKIESAEVLKSSATAPQSATALLGRMKILVPLAGLIDVEAEAERLERQISKFRKLEEQSNRKLTNESFVSNAPARVVEQERQRLQEHRAALAKLEEQRESIRAMA
ncbi:MAG TPA: valine--tRNA ligase [Gammaproteobacteria bacterium]|nr:valine--tRNA ligase [Gammaproteobacteria bacterium]